MRTWKSLSKAEREAAIKKYSRFRDPVQARKNWEVHERSNQANVRSASVALMQRLISGWEDENGNTIPKTPSGIPLHRALVARFRKKFPGGRLNSRSIELRYKSIHQRVEQERKAVAYAAYHKKAAEKRERERIAREVRIKKESAAREKAHKAASIRQAKRNVRRLTLRIVSERKQIAILEGYIHGDTKYITRIEPKLDGWKGTSLHSAMVRNVKRTKERRAKRIDRLYRDQRYLAAFEGELRDNQRFLSGGRESAKPAKDGSLDLRTVEWTRIGKFLKPEISLTRQTDIWIRSNGTGKLRVTSSRDYDGTTVNFTGFTVKLRRYRRDFYAAHLTVLQVKGLGPTR